MAKEYLKKTKNLLLQVFIGTTDIQAAHPTKATVRLLALVTAAIATFVTLSYLSGAKIDWCFREGRPMTWCSVFQLLIVGFISAEIYKVRQVKTPQAKLWHYLSIIFIYLACDDLLRLHEFYDHRICEIFGWDKHGPADHIDDVIVGLYGVGTVGLLLYYWQESKLFFKKKTFFFLAALSATCMVIMDLTDGSDGIIMSFLGTTPETKEFTIAVLDIIEETFKTYAGVFFIGAFLWIMRYCTKENCVCKEINQQKLAANGN